MEALVLLAALAVMLVGLLGVVVPVMPGLLLVWLAGVGSVLWQGADLVGWLVAAALTVLLLLGSAATVVLPTRQGLRGGIDRRTVALVALGAAVGFVVVPVVGLLLGAAVGLYAGQLRQRGGHEEAWRGTARVLRAYGAGVLVELAVGVSMIALWSVTVVLRA